MFEFFNSATLFKFLKFGAVGLSGLFVDFGLTYLCKEIIRIPKYISNAIGFTAAASSNYILNRIWTFQSHNPDIGYEYLRFFIVSFIGLGINTLILWLLVSRFKMHFYLSKFFAICVVILWNFAANLIFTFSN